ncbi:unnamed protein product [Dicrocoelium dendriticum]|nr:unnamed protein product [Dicrocoelium dendriticum]
MNLRLWFIVVACFICLGPFVTAHHGGGANHSDHHEEGHHDEAVSTSQAVPTSQAAKPDGKNEVDQRAAQDEANGKGKGQKSEAESKFISLNVWHGGAHPAPEKLIVFNTERYGNWSDWSECLTRDCIEVRYRTCLDDSWERPSPSKIHTTKCLSKYYAEKRTCENKTACSSPVVLENCGIRPKTTGLVHKILGGESTSPNSWPWAVRLSVRPPRRNAITFCGGTLITPQWILTAGHCLLVENKRMPVGRLVLLSDYMKSTIYAHVGDHHRSKKEETQQDYQVTKAAIHPRYHRRLTTDGDDIALLYLAEPVKLMPEVNYACLPTKDMVLEPGTKCYAVGWGSTQAGTVPTFDDIQSILDSLFIPFPDLFSSFGRYPFSHFRRRQHRRDTSADELQEVELPIVSMDQCRRHYTELNDELHICAGSKGKDTCSGDSGGGLYCQLPKSESWFVAGVTSFGLARGCGLNPGVYTSAIAHVDWISRTIQLPIF